MIRRVRSFGLASLPSLLATLCACGSSGDAGSTPADDAGARPADATTPGPAPSGDAGTDLDSSNGSTGDGASDSATPPADASTTSSEGGDAGATVTGRCVYSTQGIAGLTVVVQGKSAVTSATGAFTLAGISVPYDLSVIIPASIAEGAFMRPNVVQFVGLHGVGPVLPLSPVTYAPSTAQVTGTVTGGAPQPNQTFTGFGVVAESPTAVRPSSAASAGARADKSFGFSLDWPSDEASDEGVSFFALQYTPDTGIPTSYGFAGTYIYPTPVASGATLANVDIPLVATTDSFVSGTIVIPAGYTQVARGINVQTPGRGGFFFSDTTAASEPTFHFATPTAPFVTGIDVSANAEGPAGESTIASLNVTPGSTGNTLTLPEPPLVLGPPANQAGVDLTTTFSWTSVPGQHCLYDVSMRAGVTGSTVFDIQTTSTLVTIPDLSAFGAGLTSLAKYNWHVTCYATASAVTIDDAATMYGVTSFGDTSPAGQTFTAK